MKVLFLTSRLPFPPLGGDKLRTFHFIKRINEECDLTVISFIEHDAELKGVSEYRRYMNKLVTVKLPRLESYANCARGLLSRKPLQVHYYASRRMRAAVAEELREHYDVVVCHLIRMAQYLPDAADIRKVIDFTDAISLCHDRSRPFKTGLASLINAIEARRVRPYEYKSMARADLSIFISSVDANHLVESGAASPIEVVTNGVDLDRFSYHSAAYDPDQIVFLGNMRTFPNTDAVAYFAQQIFPLIKAVRREARFSIVGNQPTRRVRSLHDGNSITVTGRVDDVVPYLANAAVLVAPMRVSAGVQNKILEALAVGTPVVTTSIGAEGLDADVIHVADAPQEFARATLALMEQGGKRREISLAGRRWVQEHYSWDQALHRLNSLLGQPVEQDVEHDLRCR